MALDPRSRERLEALGRTLPRPLPAPDPARQPRKELQAPRHAVETEQNPQQLFRELMSASSDGSVPPHLLDRLRQLEKPPLSRRTALPAEPAASASRAPSPSPEPSASAGRRSAPLRRPGRSGRPLPPGSEEAELYTAFAQLLLEDEELD